MAALQIELQDTKEALTLEQQRVSELVRLNQELQDRLDHHHSNPSDIMMQQDVKLGHGSLFYELSKHLEQEFEARKQKECPQPPTNALEDSTPSAILACRSQEEENILKEFFLLTATAVKIAGGGLRNDRCNILNEALYDQAQAEGITFDQYHKWLEARLENDLEVHRYAMRMELKMR